MKNKPKKIPILLIEDDLRRIQWFGNYLPIDFRLIVARSGGTALGMIKRDKGHVYGGIMLDHDLQMRQVVADDGNISGSQLVDAIITCISPDVPILVHSMNPEKSPMMVRKLSDAGFWVTKETWFDITEDSYMEWLEGVQEEWNDYWAEE